MTDRSVVTQPKKAEKADGDAGAGIAEADAAKVWTSEEVQVCVSICRSLCASCICRSLSLSLSAWVLLSPSPSVTALCYYARVCSLYSVQMVSDSSNDEGGSSLREKKCF